MIRYPLATAVSNGSGWIGFSISKPQAGYHARQPQSHGDGEATPEGGPKARMRLSIDG
jgi:hypothetical protein